MDLNSTAFNEPKVNVLLFAACNSRLSHFGCSGRWVAWVLCSIWNDITDNQPLIQTQIKPALYRYSLSVLVLYQNIAL